jgi:hypothetical protein
MRELSYSPHNFMPSPGAVVFCALCTQRFRDHPYYEEELATAIAEIAHVYASLSG